MAVIFDSDAYSRKSRRHGTSGRRRTTTSYDKYGYQIATVGSSSGSESVMHVLRVRPGVVVNFIDAPSHSSRNSRSRASSHHVAEHISGHQNARHHETGHERESPWETTHSPHPRALEILDETSPPPPFAFESPPTELLPPGRRSTHSPPSPHPHPETTYPPPPPEPQPVTRHSPSTPVPHFVNESQYTSQPREAHREASAPIDIPLHARSSSFTRQSPPSAVSSTLDSWPELEREVQPCYYARHQSPTPIDIPIQISSGRNLSRSFDYPFHGTHSPESSSPPSTTRTVRFNENPVEPSPSPVVRRKGWWNRRGDQLWDNDGSYAQAPERDKYPLDLHDYPEPGVGWMNEDGVQIDTKRRIVRKKPLRSALKKTSSSL